MRKYNLQIKDKSNFFPEKNYEITNHELSIEREEKTNLEWYNLVKLHITIKLYTTW